MFFPLEAGGLEEADATVPSEDGVIVACGANFFGFAKTLQCAFEEREKCVWRLTGAELSFGATLVKDACVVEALVNVSEFQEDFFGVTVTVRAAARELVGDGKAEKAERELLFWFDGENVAADGFRFFGLVEVAVEFNFGEGFGDAGVRDGFELVVHGGLPNADRDFYQKQIEMQGANLEAGSWRALPSRSTRTGCRDLAAKRARYIVPLL